jgi:hypothetical protein
MTQLEYTSDTSTTDPTARRESYLQWRKRLADEQEDLRSYGEPDPEPRVSSEWSPEALFAPAERPAAAEVAPADLAPAVIASGEPLADAAPAPALDAPWDRSEVEALLRQFRASVGSPRAVSRAVSDASSSGLTAGQSLAGHGPDPRRERGDHVVRYFDGSRVVRTTTPERARDTASVGEHLRELNRLRVEGKLTDDEFNREKRALFVRSSSARRPST